MSQFSARLDISGFRTLVRMGDVFSTMNKPSLHSICLPPEHPPEAPKLGFNTNAPSHGHWSDPDSDELRTHSQTQPYLLKEPTACVKNGGIDGFFRHVFLSGISGVEAHLDLTDLKYDSTHPRQ